MCTCWSLHNQDNIFQLNKSELRQREVGECMHTQGGGGGGHVELSLPSPSPFSSLPSLTDVIDIVRDQLSGNDYKVEEDPRQFVSQRTGRGPLPDDWVSHPPNGVIICAYKLIKVSQLWYSTQCQDTC